MSKLHSLQSLVTNDLTVFHEPYFQGMRPVLRPGSRRYRVSSLELFETWFINGIVGGRKPSLYSASPGLWNPYFQQLGKEAVFFAFDLPTDKSFSDFLSILLAVPGFLELTVTDPYKAEAFTALSSIRRPFRFSMQAEHLRVVNHIILDAERDKVLGLNTDGLGMVRSIKKAMGLDSKLALILGAGGSAASIGYELLKEGCSLFIANRTISRAEALTRTLSSMVSTSRSISFSGFDELALVLAEADLIVNTVTEGCPLGEQDASRLKRGVLLAETKYGRKAELKTLAERIESPYIDGLAMLYGQFLEAACFVYPLIGALPGDHRRAIQPLC